MAPDKNGWIKFTDEEPPKDGTEILIAGGTVLYDAETYPTDEPFSGVTIVHWYKDGWFGGFGSEYDAKYWHKPTHWQLLPPPPESTHE